MDASASRSNCNIINELGTNQGNSLNSSNTNHKNSVTKYTRIPDFDNYAPWSPNENFTQLRSRRYVSFDEPSNRQTSRSLKSVVIAQKRMISNLSRKIVTIEENTENDSGEAYYTFPNELRNRHTKGSSLRSSIESNSPTRKHLTQRKTKCFTVSGGTKCTAKSNILNIKNNVKASKLLQKEKYSKLDNQINDTIKKKTPKEDNVRFLQNKATAPKISIRRTHTSQSEDAQQMFQMNNKFLHDIKKENVQAKTVVNVRQSRGAPAKPEKGSNKNLREKGRPVTVIVVPRDDKQIKVNSSDSNESSHERENLQPIDKQIKINRSTAVAMNTYKDIKVGTVPFFNLVEKGTQISEILKHKSSESDIMDDRSNAIFDSLDIPKGTQMSEEFLQHNSSKSNILDDRSNGIFDSLDIPNVSLTKDKNDNPKEEIVNFLSQSMPNIRVPALNMFSLKETQNEKIFCRNNSYIISRARVTYTSKQKIDFKVVENHDNNLQNHLLSSPLSYPLSVVSTYKKELAKREYNNSTEYNEKKNENDAHISEQQKNLTFNRPLVSDSDKLKKPSDIISTIKLGNSLLQNTFLCEQFHRELNFIDSFFESLQYLETCSLGDKSCTENNIEHWINSSYNFDCGSFLSKFENEICVENETMASTSLCRLNLLIRHEQRRARNLLFVLKMREDALKDFTKSQILWLENKKKQENIDISTLKKKQRGALLKLQHECGEMQRIRKALLTRSEKRKIVLMKTKKNLEWKCENNLDVEKKILGKKKMNRLSSDRSTAPVKCFDLSSSGCDESTTSRPRSNTPVILDPETSHRDDEMSKDAETSVQALCDNKLEEIASDQSFATASENYVVVDGSYLNIVFKDLSLPQIFSGEKQYEVNEEAMKIILGSLKAQKVETQKIVDENPSYSEVDKIVDQIKSHEPDASSPSTARSLVEELDSYFQGLDDFAHSDNSEPNYVDIQSDIKVSKPESSLFSYLTKSKDDVQSNLPISSWSHSPERSSFLDTPLVSDSSDDVGPRPEELRMGASVAGPLPIPAGAAAVSETPINSPSEQDKPLTAIDESVSSGDVDVFSRVSSLATNEAEELRRQQLAIEKEIKVLEQQQSHFLAVREIPDKPPPPYTPPVETRPPKPPRSFAIDVTTTDRIRKCMTDTDHSSDTDLDAFKLFVKDYCRDSSARHKAKQMDKAWNTCQVVQEKQQISTEKLVKETADDLKEVLTCVSATVLSGVDARRTDHIDDILFAEWRRCEPEWTSLHNDELVVKNQLFEDIFDKVLIETVQEYKKIIVND